MEQLSRANKLESRYLQKCRELRSTINEIEQYNELLGLSIVRTRRDIKRLILEKCLLKERLEEKTIFKIQESDGEESALELDNGFSGRKKTGGSGDTSYSTDLEESKASRLLVTPVKRLNTFTSKKSSTSNGQREESAEPYDDDDPVTPSSCGISSNKSRKQPTRDPNLPKRPQNAYIIFCDMEKTNVKKELETSNNGHPVDLTKAMAEKWHTLSDLDRQKFYEIYEEDRERYAREMVAHELVNPSPSERKEKQRAEKILNDIKRSRREGKRPKVRSGSHLAKVIEATSGGGGAAIAMGVKIEAKLELDLELKPEPGLGPEIEH